MLGRDLTQASDLLHKYGHHAQGKVVDEMIASLEAADPDYKRLASVDMWGGPGAVWEVCLTPSSMNNEQRADETTFRKAIIRVAAAMDALKIGTERSQFIAKTLQGWIDKGF